VIRDESCGMSDKSNRLESAFLLFRKESGINWPV